MKTRKHQFYNTGIKPFEGISNWELHKCRNCLCDSGLNAEQIKELPIDMAKCDSPDSPIITFWEKFWYYIFDRKVNCLEKN